MVLGLLRALSHEIAGVCDPELTKKNIREWEGLPVLGDDSFLETASPDQYVLALGIGKLQRDNIRETLYDTLTRAGFTFPALIHPAAYTDASVNIQNGAQVMAGAVVQAGSEIGENTIINTKAGIDHDCKIGAHVHVAPGVTVCGNVKVEQSAFIGAGATILPGVTIAAGEFVKAASLVSGF